MANNLFSRASRWGVGAGTGIVGGAGTGMGGASATPSEARLLWITSGIASGGYISTANTPGTRFFAQNFSLSMNFIITPPSKF